MEQGLSEWSDDGATTFIRLGQTTHHHHHRHGIHLASPNLDQVTCRQDVPCHVAGDVLDFRMRQGRLASGGPGDGEARVYQNVASGVTQWVEVRAS